MSNVIPFTDHRGKLFYVARCEIEVNGKLRKRWAVVQRDPDGGESFHRMRSEKEAIWLSDVLREVETKRRKEEEFLAKQELWQSIMCMPVESREFLLALLQAEKRRRTEE